MSRTPQISAIGSKGFVSITGDKAFVGGSPGGAPSCQPVLGSRDRPLSCSSPPGIALSCGTAAQVPIAVRDWGEGLRTLVLCTQSGGVCRRPSIQLCFSLSFSGGKRWGGPSTPIKEGCGDGDTSGNVSVWFFLRGEVEGQAGFLVSLGSPGVRERNKDAAGLGDAWLLGS